MFVSPLPTRPGIDIKVTPERDAPIIPMATKIHGDFLLAIKNALLLESRPVKYDTAIKKIKYPAITARVKTGLSCELIRQN